IHHGRGGYFFSVLVVTTVVCGWTIRQTIVGNVEAGLIFYLSALFWVAGLLYWRYYRRPSTGVLTTTASFVAWGAVFPVSQVLAAFHVGPPQASVIWDLPKYFVAFGMILTLLENQTERANDVAKKYHILFERNLAAVYVSTLAGDLID